MRTTKRHVSYVLGLVAAAIVLAGCGHYLPSQGWITLNDGPIKFRKLLVEEL